jgi:uncharacterized damage-inducible protein DinB
VNPADKRIAKLVRADAHKYFDMSLPRIVSCLRQLSEKDIWWRPNPASNSAGNLVLHLCGNIRQWIISGLGGSEDIRERDKEFSEQGPVPRRELIARLQATVAEAGRVIDRLPAEALVKNYRIQGFRVSGPEVVSQVANHLSYHVGQIIYLTKLKSGRDLRFTKLPRVTKRPGK